MLETDGPSVNEVMETSPGPTELSALSDLITQEKYERSFGTYLRNWNGQGRESTIAPGALNGNELGTMLAFALWQGSEELRTEEGESILREQVLAVLEERGKKLRDPNLTLKERQSLHLDMTQAILQGANLQRAILRGADLQEADLQEADFQKADLGWATLQGADLRGITLQGADLEGTEF